MANDTTYLIIHTTTPDLRIAEQIAHTLVASSLAACVQISAPITSYYRWAGTLEQSTEYRLVIKTVTSRYQEVEHCIQELHPYEVPEVIAIPAANGAPAYLQWIDTQTS